MEKKDTIMIKIILYSAMQFMELEHYKMLITTKLGVPGHVHRLITGSTACVMAVICIYLLSY